MASSSPPTTEQPPPSTEATSLPIRSNEGNPQQTSNNAQENEDLPPSYESQLAEGGRPLETAQFRAEDYAKDGKKHILIAATGSVAVIKLPDIVRALSATSQSSSGINPSEFSVRVILTDSAKHFFSGASPENPPFESLRQLPNVEGVYTDADEWAVPWQRGNAILHIELRKWADIMIVAPLDANSLAKMTNGLADNLLLSVLRAWDPEGKLNPAGRQGRRKFLAVAPAMNTAMWMHPVTKKQIKVLEEDWTEAREFSRPQATTASSSGGSTSVWRKSPGISSSHSIQVVPWARVLRPIEKDLACGDHGAGAMIDWKDIVKVITFYVRTAPY